MSQKKILVVGAGFSGATVARMLAEAGHKVLVIDRRNHIAGNAYDYKTEDGTRIHKYGPHLWHTSNQKVQDWASRFTEWHDHFHWVEALLPDGRRTPLPVNYRTVADIYHDKLTNMYGSKYGFHDIAEFIETLKIEHAHIENGRQLMESKIGTVLTELFFARYTEKMWGLTLDQLPESIAARVGARENFSDAPDNGYFNDTYQKVPIGGYTEMVKNILDHDNITVALGTDRRELIQFFDPSQAGYIRNVTFGEFEDEFDQVFTSEPLDEMYGCDLGPLKWRSIKMHTTKVPIPQISKVSVTNFTHTGPYTRMTEWKNIPGHAGNDPHITWVTTEEPCDYTNNNLERYYPVKTVGEVDENRELWKKYRDRAEADGYILIGRCANYAYLDMHQAISSAMAAAEGWLESQG